MTTVQPRFSALVLRANMGGRRYQQDTPYFVAGFVDNKYVGRTFERDGEIAIIERKHGVKTDDELECYRFEPEFDVPIVADFTELIRGKGAFERHVDIKTLTAALDDINDPELQANLREALRDKAGSAIAALAAHFMNLNQDNDTPQSALAMDLFHTADLPKIPTMGQWADLMLDACGVNRNGNRVENPRRLARDPITWRRLQIWKKRPQSPDEIS